MELSGSTVLILGGSGLVGRAIARELFWRRPSKIVIGALREEEVRVAIEGLEPEARPFGVRLESEPGDVFVRASHALDGRAALRNDSGKLAELLEDMFGPLDEAAVSRSLLVKQLERHRPAVVIDCINTATVIAYQDLFESTARIRAALDRADLDAGDVSRHLSTLYLPQLIRHVQLLMAGAARAGVRSYVKIGTSGTGGMGLNVPFTHSEEKPSRQLLAKASVAGAHSMLLFLLGRTPGAPAIVEIKPTAAIAWKGIGFGPIQRRGRSIRRTDSARPASPEEAFSDPAIESGDLWVESDEPLESVYLDAGENGLFALSEFETISSLGMMELVTPEEIAAAVLSELEGRPTGRNIIDALDASVFGPTYRGGILREAALARMEALEELHGVRSIAFEMLGPPRLNKLLFEAHILERLYGDLESGAELDADETARAAERLIAEDRRLRTDMLSIGVPIVRPDGLLLRGPTVKIEPPEGAIDLDHLTHQGWVDLRPGSWVQWRDRCRHMLDLYRTTPGVDEGSRTDIDLRAWSGRIRPGALAAMVLRVEEKGERIKR